VEILLQIVVASWVRDWRALHSMETRARDERDYEGSAWPPTILSSMVVVHCFPSSLYSSLSIHPSAPLQLEPWR